jgi:hypothetical protein
MAKKSKETSLPLLISLVFFVLLSIGLGVFCYTLKSDEAAKDEAVARAAKDRSAAQAIAKENEMIARALRTYVGIEDEEDRRALATDVKEGDKAALALRQANEAVAKKLGVEVDKMPPEFAFFPAEFDDRKLLKPPAKAGGLLDVVASKAAASNSAIAEAKKQEKNYGQARDDVKVSADRYDATRDELKKVVDETPKKFDKQIKDSNDRADRQNKTYLDEIKKARTDEQDLKDKITNIEVEKKRLEQKLAGLEIERAGLLERQKRTEDVFQFDEPQGKILRRVGDDIVEIDLGSSALVRPGLTFSVLPIDFPEKGRQSRMRLVRVPDERGRYHSVEKFIQKADIEVVEVLGPNLSRARIQAGSEADPIRDRVMPGDLLYNAVWRKGTADHVALVGIFDVNADGTDDIDSVIRDLNKMGIPVDAYYDLRKGAWVGRITERTRYVVQGAQPTNSAADPNQAAKSRLIGNISQALTDARQKGVSIVDFRDFFPRMGYRVRTDISEDRINQAAARYLSGTNPSAPDNPNP